MIGPLSGQGGTFSVPDSVVLRGWHESPPIVFIVTQPGIPNDLVLSTACYGPRLGRIEDQAFSAVAMGFRRLELGIADSPCELSGWLDAHRETGITAESVVVGALYPKKDAVSGSFLGSLDEELRDRALNLTRRHICIAQQLGAPVVVVRGCAVEDEALTLEARALSARLEVAQLDDLDAVQVEIRDLVGRVQKLGQKQLESFCRSLHSLRRAYPDLKLALEPGFTFNDLLNFEAMQWVLDDLDKSRVGYWHDTGGLHSRELAGLPGQGPWLDAFASKLRGVHLSDSTVKEQGLPPGMGDVDFQLVASYLPEAAVRVIEANSIHGRAEILASVNHLMSKGF